MYGGPSIGRKWLPRDKLADDWHPKGKYATGKKEAFAFPICLVVSLILFLDIIAVVRRCNYSSATINKRTYSFNVFDRDRKCLDDILRMRVVPNDLTKSTRV